MYVHSCDAEEGLRQLCVQPPQFAHEHSAARPFKLRRLRVVPVFRHRSPDAALNLQRFERPY